MTNAEQLAVAVTAAVAVEMAKATTTMVIDWLKGNCGQKVTHAIERLAEDRTSGPARRMLEGRLRIELEESPLRAQRIRELLCEVGGNYAPLTATATGGSTVTQVQGNDNRVVVDGGSATDRDR